MRRRVLLLAMAAVLASASSPDGRAQVAGSTTLGVTVTELDKVLAGWSARRQILGHPVYNEMDEKVGVVDDLIVSPEKAVSYAIIGAGGFVGLGRHDVAIPVNQFQQRDDKLILEGATKEAVKAMPEFRYAEHRKRS